MKKLYTLLFTSLLAFNANAQVSFCESFDSSLVSGDPIAQTSPSWNTWDELMNGATAPFIDDALVDVSRYYSPPNSLYIPATAAAGPEDIVLMFDPTLNITQANLSSLSTPYVVGDFTFSQMMYVRSGGGAYFNFQAENTPGVNWALEVNFDATGDILMSNTSGTSFAAGFTHDVWFEIKFETDLSNNDWEVFIDGVSMGSFANSINQIASLDIYPRANDEYWLDDVCYSYVPATLFTNNGQISNISTISGLTGQTRYPSVEVRNFGTDPIYSCDVTFDYNGTQMTENLTNINSGFGLLSLTAMQVDFPNSITLLAGTNIGTATVSNVNGAFQDDNPADDLMSTQVVAITPVENKLVIGEEATGTWCGWCPRGAVALNFMDRDYHGYFQGIAVHNGDPMTNTDYDAGLAPYIGGYPSALVDRGTEIDPSDFELDFLQRIVTPINGTISSGAVQNGTIIDVSLDVDIQSSISGNWKLACVLVEDSVTGSGGTWYQSNSYGSNGITLIDVNGVDWGTLPNWVPDAQMIYRHVARGIAPSFDGEALDATSYNSGDQFTKCFQFTLDPTWDLTQMHIVGMLINPNGEIDNASSTSIATSIANGFHSCNSTSISDELMGPDQKLTIYPNPAVSTTTLLMTLETEEEVSISVKSIEGKLIAKGEYGTMIGSHSLTFDVSDFAKGVYVIEAQIGNEVIIKKFIKE
jgi:hypothetical protein